MKLTVATAFIAASTSPSSISTSRVAASILEHENSKGSVRTAAKKQGVECAFVNGITVWKSTDVGLLSCGMGEMCVEDSTSTMGGRCKVLVSTKDETADLEPHRERELCVKCVGDGGGTEEDACTGVADQSKIGCGSCLGIAACLNLAPDVTIGANSCVGTYSSSNGMYACAYAEGELNIVWLDGSKICQ